MELRAQVNQSQRVYRIINSASQLAELRRYSADRKLTAAKDTGVERAKNQLKRDLDFVKSMLEACSNMKEMLEESLARINNEISRHNL